MKTKSISETKAIVVDYYGTLVDMGQPFIEIKRWFAEKYMSYIENTDTAYMAFLKEHARLQYSKEFYLGQALLLMSYKRSCEKYDIPFLPKEFQKMVIQLFTHPSAFSGAQQTIEKLRKHYPVLLLTNADNQILYESIQMQGFAFDYILSSEDLQCNKPNVKNFQKACELLCTPAEYVLMIGDSLTEDVHGAMSYGMQAVWINTKQSPEADSVLQLRSVCEIESILHITLS